MSLTRIILVDDHTLFRKGLAELLEQSGSIEVTAFTGNPDDVSRLLRAHRPDVLILDLNMPGTDGITLMQQLRAEDFDLPILILTLSEAEDDLAAIYTYIRDNGSPEIAQGYIQRIHAFLRGFDTFPERGMLREDIRPGLRLVGFERRVTVAFVVEGDTVIFANILYGGRELPEATGEGQVR